MSVPVSDKCQGDIVVDMSILICPSSYRGVGNDNAHEIKVAISSVKPFLITVL